MFLFNPVTFFVNNSFNETSLILVLLSRSIYAADLVFNKLSIVVYSYENVNFEHIFSSHLVLPDKSTQRGMKKKRQRFLAHPSQFDKSLKDTEIFQIMKAAVQSDSYRRWFGNSFWLWMCEKEEMNERGTCADDFFVNFSILTKGRTLVKIF